MTCEVTMPHFPGRDFDPEEMEARSALRTLFEAEEIKMSDPEFLATISEQINRKREILDRIDSILQEEGAPTPPRSMKDFFDRLRGARREEEAKVAENPLSRRFRIAEGKRDKVRGDVVLTKFA